LQEIARAHGREVIDLDDLATRDAVSADPSLYVRGEPPVFIDEFQHAPSVLDAIKAELNIELRPGRFMLTGSTRYDALPIAAQALTGRLHLITVWQLSQGEIDRRRESFAQALLSDPHTRVSRERSNTTRDEYALRIVAAAFRSRSRVRPQAAGDGGSTTT
jgi:uncharacterized protein